MKRTLRSALAVSGRLLTCFGDVFSGAVVVDDERAETANDDDGVGLLHDFRPGWRSHI